ncbi:metallophosphoesterase [Algiphilus sp.]|uniref:metallophosphoesterase n=1 Tax=Algiphilus sp. TaxID=1872431 RepID=UPI003B52A9AB
MRIRYASDLHVELSGHLPRQIPEIGEDLVVLAGDIGEGTNGITWAAETFAGRPVLYVLGNHELYGHDFHRLVEQARDAAAATDNVQLLENDVAWFGDLRVLGCTLWTDFDAHGARTRAMDEARHAMHDYRVIRVGDRPLEPGDVLDRCRKSRAWLEDQLRASDAPTLVVTHMAPSARDELVNPFFGSQDPLTPAFANAFDHLIASPVVAWIFGHHHYSLNTTIDGVRIVSNQRGYPGEGCDFAWDRVLEL